MSWRKSVVRVLVYATMLAVVAIVIAFQILTAPGTRSSTKFTLAPSTPKGKSTLVVVANGIASPPSTVTVS